MKVYIAARLRDASYIHHTVRQELIEMGTEVVSTWHEESNFGDVDPVIRKNKNIQSTIIQRDLELTESDVVLVIAHWDSAEVFASLLLATIFEKPVFYVGVPVLSSYREGVQHCASLNEALNTIHQRVRESK